MLNSTLYDLRVYEHECPYAPVPKVVSRLQSLVTRSPIMPSDESNTSCADSQSTQVAVTDKVTSKPTPELNAARGLAPINGKMSHSSETQPDNYILQARTDPNHTETSQVGKMLIQPLPVTILGESSQLTVPATHATGNPRDLAAAVRADAAYQGMMDSLSTLIRNSLPTTLTNDNLDEFATYFSIPLDVVETRLTLLNDQLILPHIDVGTSDSNFTPGGGMAIGEPRIWTLKSEACPLPPNTESDVIAMGKIRSVLPQDVTDSEQLPWHTYVDESMLIKADLVYDKKFDPEAQGSFRLEVTWTSTPCWETEPPSLLALKLSLRLSPGSPWSLQPLSLRPLSELRFPQ
ncbi:hypothetical protein LIER_17863 [Lithospermum erythrorhizon]|uniref:Uncharacterized protein n=1 Tax=Lithospermum erythrorhizon TaxID=34254 RepID=A0AAV3QEN9_LITER